MLDQVTPYTTYRWIGTGALLVVFMLRILLAQGWYIGMHAHEPLPSALLAIDI